MMNRAKKCPTVTLYRESNTPAGWVDIEIEVEVVSYRPAPTSTSYFERSYGNYLPTDPEEIELGTARDIETGKEVILSPDEITKAEECARDLYSQEPDEPDDDEDRYADR